MLLSPKSSRVDALTGLADRSSLEATLVSLADPSVDRSGPFAVLFVDLDRFKWVNDTLGHHAGDEVLRVVSKRLENAVREGDTVARFGGDEFVIVMPNVDSVFTTTAAAKRIVESLNAPIKIGDRMSGVGASVGIALSTDGVTSERLLQQADLALYEAKSRGRGRHVIFDNRLAEKAARRMDLESAIRDAVPGGLLDVYYQPIVSLSDRSIAAYEALARMHHPSMGAISPDEFIGLAGEMGFMGEIGRWLRVKAFSDLPRLRQDCGNDSLHLATNLSAIELERSGLVSELIGDIATAGISPQDVRFEISEDLLIRDEARALRTLDELRDVGVELSLDDFGTGRSSLTSLTTVAVDEVKIDRSFVCDVENSPVSQSICTAVKVLADGVGAWVVAEGIETEAQCQLLHGMGIQFGQGYLFGKPQPIDS